MSVRQIQRAKVNAAVEQAAKAEKLAAAANKKVKQVEDEMDKFLKVTLVHKVRLAGIRNWNLT